MYGTTSDAYNYFLTESVGKQEWFDIPSDTQVAALNHAARIIDSLTYKGSKTDENQAHEFPRNSDTVVPERIVHAAYEIAYVLATNERDPELDFMNLNVVSNNFGNFKTVKSQNSIPLARAVGVPSDVAWVYLNPFLININELRIERTS